MWKKTITLLRTYIFITYCIATTLAVVMEKKSKYVPTYILKLLVDFLMRGWVDACLCTYIAFYYLDNFNYSVIGNLRGMYVYRPTWKQE